MEEAEKKRIAGLVEKWCRDFPEHREIRFKPPSLLNGYCAGCRMCCGPQPEEEPFPMALLDCQLESADRRFYMLDSHTACLDGRGCRAIGPQGCTLERNDRPPACNIFPYVLVNMRLYLYRVCPASVFMDEKQAAMHGAAVAGWLETLPREAVERISISRREADLADKYIDLGLPVRGI